MGSGMSATEKLTADEEAFRNSLLSDVFIDPSSNFELDSDLPENPDNTNNNNNNNNDNNNTPNNININNTSSLDLSESLLKSTTAAQSAPMTIDMQKFTMLLWSFRANAPMLSFISSYLSKYAAERLVFNGIEFYLPQLAHMIIHLEIDWPASTLEQFALVVANHSLHFALQLNWILVSAVEDYQPETSAGTKNPTFNPVYYSRCIKLLQNMEKSIIYGSPRASELIKLFEEGVISREEFEKAELADRRFNAFQIVDAPLHVGGGAAGGTAPVLTLTGKDMHPLNRRLSLSPSLRQLASNGEANNLSLNTARGTPLVVPEAVPSHVTSIPHSQNSGYLKYKRGKRRPYRTKPWKDRFFVVSDRMLFCYDKPYGLLRRAMPLESAVVRVGERGDSRHDFYFEVMNQNYQFLLRAESREEREKWVELLMSESKTAALFSLGGTLPSSDALSMSGSNSHSLVAALSPQQRERYNFFKGERDFVRSLCDIAEELRFEPRPSRKRLAPELIAETPIPPCAYVPMCKSTDKWLRVISMLPLECRVFSTKARCPVLMCFECVCSSDGEDVAEYLHAEFELGLGARKDGDDDDDDDEGDEEDGGESGDDSSINDRDSLDTFGKSDSSTNRKSNLRKKSLFADLVMDEIEINAIAENEEDAMAVRDESYSSASLRNEQNFSSALTVSNGGATVLGGGGGEVGGVSGSGISVATGSSGGEQGQGQGGGVDKRTPTKKFRDGFLAFKTDSLANMRNAAKAAGIDIEKIKIKLKEKEKENGDGSNGRLPRAHSNGSGKKKIGGVSPRRTLGKTLWKKDISLKAIDTSALSNGGSGDNADAEAEAENDGKSKGGGNIKINKRLQNFLKDGPSVKMPKNLTALAMNLKKKKVTKSLSDLPSKDVKIYNNKDDSYRNGVNGGSAFNESAHVISSEAIMRAKQYVCGGENWNERCKRLREANGRQGQPGVVVTSVIAKSNDDVRQEVFIMQLIHFYQSVFKEEKLPIFLKPYRILSVSKETGLIELLTDSTSIDGLKKSAGYPSNPDNGGLGLYFEAVYGPRTGSDFKAAQNNFMHSLVGYSIVCYVLGLKDRHNGNIMINTKGQLIHIDFGFAMGMAPGHEWSMERAPFKLTKDYVDVLGGVHSEKYKEFKELFIVGFKAARSCSKIAMGLIEIMMYKSNYPCFLGSRYGNGIAIPRIQKRLMLEKAYTEAQIDAMAGRLVDRSFNHFGTVLYDKFQLATNGIAP